MLIEYTDFNDAEESFRARYRSEWAEIYEVLISMPLHLKASDQAGIQGNPIFDPVGTNLFIKDQLVQRKWLRNQPLPNQFKFLGTDVDFAKKGVLLEAQFSNYPFLLNNVVRIELFSKSEIAFDKENPVEVAVIVTKGRIFPASNSTLYYEQALQQLRELARHRVLDAPVRLIGLQESVGSEVPAKWTRYHSPRYSRTIVSQRSAICRIEAPRNSRSRCKLTLTP